MQLNKLTSRKLTWVDISKYRPKEILDLKRRFKLHPFSIRELTSDSERSKVDAHGDAVFITHLYPYFDRTERKVRQTEINIMVSKGRIITFHQGKIPVIETFMKTCRKDRDTRESAFVSQASLLYEIMSRLLDYTHPMLDHFAVELTDIESQLLDGREKDVLEDTMHIRRNITDFRRIMMGHKNTMKRFKTVSSTAIGISGDEIGYYVNDLITHTKDIWERLDAYKEGVETLQQTNESLVTFKINNVMKVVAVLTSLMLPITIITGLFGVNARNMPFIGLPNDFMIILGISLASMLVMLAVFWYKRWLN